MISSADIFEIVNKRRIMHKKSFSLRVVCCIAILMGLITFGAYGAQTQEQFEQKVPFSRVFVLNPFIVYEDARNEQNLQTVDPSAQLVFEDSSAQWAADVFSTAGIENTGSAALTSAQMESIKESYDLLNKSGEDLVKQWKDKQAYLNAFSAIKNISGADCLLVQFVKVKVGERGTWDFMYSGKVTPTTSSTAIKLALIDLNTGKAWWSNASIEHAMPDKNSVGNLYKNSYGGFPGYKPKKGGTK